MEKRILLLINPKSGKGRYRGEIANILDVLCRDGAVTVQITKYPGHASVLARQGAEQYDIIVCLGGDGTLAETVAGLMESEVRPPLGYIPMGTANDMATTLHLPKDGKKAAEVILEGQAISLDVGRFKNSYFTYIAAFGAFTEVAYQTPSGNKQALGHLAYVLEGLGRMRKITPRKLAVEYDEQRIEGEFVFGAVTNTTSIAGLLRLSTDMVDLSDGAFEVILVKNPRNILDLNTIFMDIVTKKYESEYIQIFRAKQVRFLFEEPVSWTRDGEAGGVHEELCLHTISPGVQIFVPKEKE